MNTKTKTVIAFVAIVLGLILSPAVASTQADIAKANASLADRYYSLVKETSILKTELPFEENVFFTDL